MVKGIIVKGIGGFYYVDIGDEIIECKARGHFRNKKMSPCVGDHVLIDIDSDKKGSINEIFERVNSFIRPPVSNIDELIIVSAASNPAPDTVFIDKMLVIANHAKVDVKLCFNKADIDDGVIDDIAHLYVSIGCDVHITSAREGKGIDGIRKLMKDKIVAFSGFSGVGKSSLLNAITDNEVMQTGEVSERLKRGKHTTRHVELIKFNDGYIVDTPGFSMLDFPEDITKDMLKDYFPEFEEYSQYCKFRDCNHVATSNVCAVCGAVEEGNIPLSRYNNYKSFYDVLSRRKEWKK